MDHNNKNNNTTDSKADATWEERDDESLSSSVREILELLSSCEGDEDENHGELTAAAAAALSRPPWRTEDAVSSSLRPEVSLRDFVDMDDGNLWATAYRWRAYWEERIRLFGTTTTTTPLPTDDGDDDLRRILESGIITPDGQRQDVLHVNLSSHGTTSCHTSIVQRRHLFVWGHLMTALRGPAEAPTSTYHRRRREFAVVMSYGDFTSLSVSVVRRVYGTLCRSFPVRLRALHLTHRDEDTTTNTTTPETPLSLHLERQLSQLPKALQNIIVRHDDNPVHANVVPPPMDKEALHAWLRAKGVIADDTVSSLDTKSMATTKGINPTDSQSLGDLDTKDTVSTANDGAAVSQPPSRSEYDNNNTNESSEEPFACPTPVAVTHGDAEINFIETSDIQNQGQMQIQEAIDAMTTQDRAAYARAQRVAPHLVRHETPALWFLRYDRYDPWAAARRLVTYWTQRVQIFGPERAFRPMSQTGRGTLSPDDVRVLRTGYLVLLPETRSGHVTLCYDASRLRGPDDAQSRQRRLRCFFYFVSVLMEEEIHRSDGLLMMGILNDFTLRRSFGQSGPARLMESAIPVTARQLHAVRCGTMHLPFLKRALPRLLQLCGKGARRVAFHLGDPTEVRTSLEAAGFAASVLPAQVGGDWTYDQFAEWCEERCQFELERYPSMATTTASRPAMPLSAAASKEEDDPQTLAQNALEAFVDSKAQRERADRRRKLRRVYSRQKRKRQQVRINDLHEKVYDLRGLQTSLQAEHQRLQDLLQQARGLVQAYGVATTGLTETLFAPTTTQLIGLCGAPLLINTPGPYAGAFPGRHQLAFPYAPRDSTIAATVNDLRKPPPSVGR